MNPENFPQEEPNKENTEETKSDDSLAGVKKAVALGGLIAAIAVTEGCTPSSGQAEKSTDSKAKVEHISAASVEQAEKAADEAVISFLTELSGNGASGNRIAKVEGNYFIEVDGSFYELHVDDLSKMRGYVFDSGHKMQTDSSAMRRSMEAKALGLRIRSHVELLSKRIEKADLLPETMRARFAEVESFRKDGKASGVKRNAPRQSTDFDKDPNF